MYNQYYPQNPALDFNAFMEQKMRDARNEFNQQLQASFQRQVPQMQTENNPQQYSPQMGTNNSNFVEVQSRKEAEEYPVNKDGDTIILNCKAEDSIFIKRFNIGRGLWDALEVYKLVLSKDVIASEQTEQKQPDLLQETLDKLNERLDTIESSIKKLETKKATTYPINKNKSDKEE